MRNRTVPIIILLILNLNFLLLTCLYSAFEFKPQSARPVSLGNAFTGLSDDVSAIDYNPAGLRKISSFQFLSAYSLLYSVEGLNYSQFKLALPVRNIGTIGISYSDFGPAEYKERVLIFSHGFGLRDGIMFGYNLKSMNIKIQEFGSDTSFGLDLGILSRISDKLNLGIAVKNINEPEISQGHEKLGEEFLTGISYKPLNGVNFVLDFDKVLGKMICMHTGAEFNVTNFLALRIGLQTSPSKYNMGFGVNYNKIFLDYAYSYNDTLPGTHILSLSMKFNTSTSSDRVYTELVERAQDRPFSIKNEELKIKKIEKKKESIKKVNKKININTASMEEIVTLPRIGGGIAKRIIDYRLKYGNFETIEVILNVPKISVKTFAKIKDLIIVSDSLPANVVQIQESTETITTPIVEPEQKLLLTETVKININEADLKQLKSLGFTTIQSQNILRYKKKNGAFVSVDNLLKVPGITEKIINDIKDNIFVK
ncbi:MAG: hypothetical protein A2539_06740 [Elusimicrobia bacterium RIFOXYD2_FULL_34_15]|nr:MAG: hypothetical protein A2539_06740 [Elusimicrobia bacterium RIFOXYD2_FULL_34_15]